MDDELRDLLADTIAAVTVEPGDKLVVGVTHRVHPDEAESIQAQWRQMVPGTDLIIVGDCSAMAVVKSGNGGSAHG